MNFKIIKIELGIKSRMELFRFYDYDWQGDTFDEPFFGLLLLLTIWQGDTFDQF